MRDALAIEVQIGFFDDGYVIELSHVSVLFFATEDTEITEFVDLHFSVSSVVSVANGSTIFPFRCDPHAQRIEFDKATGIGLVIGARIVFKRGDGGVKQRIGF